MTRGSYSGRDLVLPVGRAYAHELDLAAPHLAKWRYSVEVVERYGVKSVVELFAGYGALSVEYAAAGARVVLAVEYEPTRFAALVGNVPLGVALNASNLALPEGIVFDADLVDLDPYDYPFDAIIANRSRFVRPTLLLATTAILGWRYNYRKRNSFLAKMRAATYGASRRFETEVASSYGRGFSRLVVTDFLSRFFEVEYLGEMELPSLTIERALWRVAPKKGTA